MFIFVGSQNIQLIWPVCPEFEYVLMPCFHTFPDIIFSLCWTAVFKLVYSEKVLGKGFSVIIHYVFAAVYLCALLIMFFFLIQTFLESFLLCYINV